MSTRKQIGLFAGLSAGLLILLFFIVWAASGFEGLGLGFHGTLALVLGALFSAAVGIALMALIFYSNRSGTDQSVQETDRHPK